MANPRFRPDVSLLAAATFVAVAAV